MDHEMTLATTRPKVQTMNRTRSGVPIRRRMLAKRLFSHYYTGCLDALDQTGHLESQDPGRGLHQRGFRWQFCIANRTEALGSSFLGLFEWGSMAFPHTARNQNANSHKISDWRKLTGEAKKRSDSKRKVFGSSRSSRATKKRSLLPLKKMSNSNMLQTAKIQRIFDATTALLHH